jgi:hypothetical protein
MFKAGYKLRISQVLIRSRIGHFNPYISMAISNTDRLKVIYTV